MHISVNLQTRNGLDTAGYNLYGHDRAHRQREEVMRGIPFSDKGWTSTNQYDYPLEQLLEVETLPVSQGAIDNGWISGPRDVSEDNAGFYQE